MFESECFHCKQNDLLLSRRELNEVVGVGAYANCIQLSEVYADVVLVSFLQELNRFYKVCS